MSLWIPSEFFLLSFYSRRMSKRRNCLNKPIKLCCFPLFIMLSPGPLS